MSIVLVTALIDCDDCGGQFRVGLDPADVVPTGWSIADEVEDAVRGGNVHDVLTADCARDSNICSVRDDKMLCPKCTEKHDAANPDVDAHIITDAIDRAEGKQP